MVARTLRMPAMAERRTLAALVPPSPEQRKIAGENFDRARQVIAGGNYDYGIQLLLTCCKIDPGNLAYRQTLRKAQKDKFGNNGKGSLFAFLSTKAPKARAKAAKSNGDYRRALEFAEQVLCRNPWEIGTLMDMSESFDALGLVDLAIFSLDSARGKDPKNATINRALARLFEKRGEFKKAIALWQMVREANPADVEANHKAKDLAASETIARGGYEQVISGSKESPVLATMEQKAADQAEKQVRDVVALQKRIEADPTEPTLYVQLAALFKKSNEWDRAKATLQQGLGPTGQNFALQSELQELELLPFRRQLEAVQAKLTALRNRPADDDTRDDLDGEHTELRQMQHKLSKEINSREIEITRLRADRFPLDLSHRLELGTKLLKADLVDQAITELQQAKRDDKLKGRAAMHLGHCFRARNNWRLAQRNFEEALLALPTNDDANRKEVLFQLATGHAESGDTVKALDLGHELANLDFSYKNIGTLLDSWQPKS
jgi:tetratricopeptide (TPR) repeat protein